MQVVKLNREVKMKEEYKIHEQDAFLAKNKKQFEKGAIEKDALKAKKQTMNSITKDITSIPEKLHVIGPLSKPSAKPAAKGENPLEGGAPKEFSEE